MIRIDDYKTENGDIDWAACRAAQKAAGATCSRCGRYLFGAEGSPQECFSCLSLDKPEEVAHDSTVRCPDCGYTWDVHNGDYCELFEDGEHNVTCQECDHDFEISTSVSWSFRSPPRLPKIEKISS